MKCTNPFGCLLIFETAVYHQKHNTRIPDGERPCQALFINECNGLNKVGMVETEEMEEGNGRLSVLATDYAVWVFVDF